MLDGNSLPGGRMTEQDILSLLKRYEAGKATEREKRLLEQWFAKQSASNEWHWVDEKERSSVKQLMQDRISVHLFSKKPKPWFTPIKMGIAASLILASTLTFWIYNALNRSHDSSDQFYTEEAVEPGKRAALLTLADGSTLRLDDIHAGTLLHDRGLEIKKLENGELLYDATGTVSEPPEGDTRTNTIRIPRGGQYRIILPDGTKVWLNSATTLIYPTVFTGKERIVNLTGEAYFEVAKNQKQPFKVNALGTEIHVTGTHFNVTAYNDEFKVTTTLVEGRVTVSKNQSSVNLTPGTQAISGRQSDRIDTKEVDTDYALAWIYGDFLFEDQDIRTIMKDIARWYNVEVVFKGTPGEETFGGTYARSKGLEELLKHLESLSDIRFELNGRRVTVMM